MFFVRIQYLVLGIPQTSISVGRSAWLANPRKDGKSTARMCLRHLHHHSWRRRSDSMAASRIPPWHPRELLWTLRERRKNKQESPRNSVGSHGQLWCRFYATRIVEEAVRVFVVTTINRVAGRAGRTNKRRFRGVRLESIRGHDQHRLISPLSCSVYHTFTTPRMS